jgi:hypothetical protein
LKSFKPLKHFGVLLVVGLICIALAMPVFAESEFKYGDVNSTGEVDVADAILVLRHIVGLITLEGDDLHAADVNASGAVDVADAILILRKIVGLIEIFPAQENLDEAEAAVIAAETSLSQEDVDSAAALVEALPPIPPKTALLERLEAVQEIIDQSSDKALAIAAAIAAIDELPAPGDLTLAHEGAVEAARGLVNTAIDDHGADEEDITNLQDLIDAEGVIDALKAATAAVEAAEASQEQADLDAARALVDALPAGGAKNALSARLDAVQIAINKEAAIQAAIAAIGALPLPGDLTLEDGDAVAAARALVDTAKSVHGATNDDITNLSILVEAEATIVALGKATDAVEAAEASNEQGDVYLGRALVNLLPDGAAKTALSDRLDAVQAGIDQEAAIAAAIAAIDELPAPGDLTLAHEGAVEAARGLVNTAIDDHGADEEDITNLQDLIDAEAVIDALKAATAAVEAAEASQEQADLDAARALVDALPAGGAKNALSARLDAVQIAINKEAAIQAAIAAIGALPLPGDLTLEDGDAVAAARALVDTAKSVHGATNDDITNLSILVEAEATIVALGKATDAVEAAEASNEQGDVYLGRALVNLLPDGAAKTALSDRLDAVQAGIDQEAAIAVAIAAIDGLPAPGDLTLAHEGAVEAARGLVNTAIDDHGAEEGDITNLQDLIDAEAVIGALKAATAAVEAAEASQEQADLDAARALVDALPAGGAKNALSARLDAVQIAINKEAAIQAAIAAIGALPLPGDLTLEDGDAVAAARALVDTAKSVHGATNDDITNLSILVEAEATIVALGKATDAVEAAEASNEQGDVYLGRALVNLLPDGAAKTALSDRLDAVQAGIDQEAAIAVAIAAIDGLPAPGDLTLAHEGAVEAARGLVNTAIDDHGAEEGDITNLQDLIDAEAVIGALKAATAAVEAAEASQEQADLDAARALVDALPAGGAKNALSARLDDLQGVIDARAAVEEATAAVEAAEDSLDRDDVNYAFGLVIDLPDSAIKAELLHRLEVVLTEIEKQAAIAEVIAAIEALPAPGELTLADEEDVVDVRYLVKAVKSAHGVTDEEITNLDKLVDAEAVILALRKAEAAVEMAEDLKIQGNVDFARGFVEQLPEGGAKAALNSRLDAVEVAIPVAVDVVLAEEGDKEVGEEFALLLTIVNKHGDAIPYAEAPGTTVITSDLDGELFSEEIAYDGEDGEAVATLSLQKRGIHFITVKVAGVSGTVNVTVPQTFSEYAMTIDGPDELEVGKAGFLSLRVWAEEPFGNSSLTATCEYEVTGGEYGLFQGVGLFGLSGWFELAPDYDQTTALMFIPQEAVTYEIKATLRSTDSQVLGTASYTVKAGVVISGVADIDDIDVDYGTPLEEIGLPEQVEVTLADGTICDIAVAWDEGTPAYDGFIPGTYTFKGTLVPEPGMVNPDGLTASVIAVMQDPFLLALVAVNRADNKTEMKAVLEDHAFFLGIDVGEGSAYAALYDHPGGWATYSQQLNAANFVIDKREAVYGGAYASIEEVVTAFNQGVAYELGKLDFHAAVAADDLDRDVVEAVRDVYHTMGTILGVLEDEELAPLLAMLDCYLEDLSEGEQQRVDAYVLDTVTGSDRKLRDKVFNAMNNEVEAILAERAALAAVNAVEVGPNYGQNERKQMRAALEENAAVLGIDLTEYNKITVEGRKDAVGWDLLGNRPEEGYTVASLQSMLNEIVMTRQVTEESMDLVNETEVLEDIAFAVMLLDRFKAAEDENYTIHSGQEVAGKIALLEDLVERYGALDESAQALVLAKVMAKRPFTRSQATTDALAAALDEVEAALAAINAVEVGPNYGQSERKQMRAALEENAAVLGIDLTEYNKITVEGRKDAVGWDLLGNRPEEGYTVASLQSMLNEIVLTRQVTEESMDLVNETEVLEDIAFAVMLLDRFKAAEDENYTIHSGLEVAGKIALLEDLVERYGALDGSAQTLVLAKVMAKRPFTRSQATTDALAAALYEVEAALAAINAVEVGPNYGQSERKQMRAALEENAAVLGIDLTEYNKITVEGRKDAVGWDLLGNRPEEGYTVASLQSMLNEIVMTRQVTEESMNLVNETEVLENIAFAVMLLNRFKAAEDENYTIHSGLEVAGKITLLKDLVERYGALDGSAQALVLAKVMAKRPFTRSQATTDALAAALYEVEAALVAINAVEVGPNYGQSERKQMRAALEENAAVLGIDLTEYNKITVEGRKDAVGWDLLGNRPEEGYTVASLQSMLNEIVLTRKVTEESMNLVNETETLENIAFAVMLLDRFKAAEDENYTIHSGLEVAGKIALLEDLVERYGALDGSAQALVLAKVMAKRPFTRSQATTDALAAALDEVEAALAAINAVEVGPNYGQSERKQMRAALEENAAVLGIDLTEYNKITVEGRKDAVGWDLLGNRPEEGYTVASLQSMLNEIVLTRQVTEESMNLVNETEVLEDIAFAVMLLNRFKAAEDENYTIHSGLEVAGKIALLEDLVERYGALDESAQALVLAKVMAKRPFTRSQATTDALAAALDEVEAALAAINAVEVGPNYGQNERKQMRAALEENAAVLGIDLTEYNKITVEGRKDAVGWDLLGNRPEEGYTVASLQSMLNEIVLTRQVTEESMNLVNETEVLEDIAFAVMLLNRFKAAEDENYTIHSGLEVAGKIALLEDLVERYGALDESAQALVLAKVMAKRPFTRSQATTDALAAALDEVEAALAAINAVEVGPNYGQNERKQMRAALEENAAVLGIDLTEYNKITVEGRKDAVGWDLLGNRPEEGYTVASLQSMLNEIVMTRQVTEESMNLVNETEVLEDIGFAVMLLDRFKAAEDENYTIHSGLEVAGKITLLKDLVERYGALDESAQALVLAKVMAKRPFTRSQATTDALAAAILEVEVNARLTITSVFVDDIKFYQSTANPEGVRVLGYGVGINLDAKGEGWKVENTESILIELYRGETLLGRQSFNEAGYSKHGETKLISGTIDVAGQYVATSWDHEWFEGITDIPDKAVATVVFADGTAVAELAVSFTEAQTKVFFAAEAVYGLFEDVFAEDLVLAEDVTMSDITAASDLVEEITIKPEQNKVALQDLVIEVEELLNQRILDEAIAAAQGAIDGLPGLVAAAVDSSVAQSSIDDAQALVDAVAALDAGYDTAIWDAVIEQQQSIVDAMKSLEDDTEELEGIVGDFSCDGLDNPTIVNLAGFMYNTVYNSVNALPESVVKSSLQERLSEVKAGIDAAQDALDKVNAATPAVEAAEEAAALLKGDGTDIQDAIDDVQALYNAAAALVDAIPEGAAKEALAARLSAVQSAIDAAQDVLDAVLEADAAVEAAEEAAEALAGDGSDSQSSITDARELYDEAVELVGVLPASEAKTALVDRLAAVEAILDAAQDVLDAVLEADAAVEAAEDAASALAGDGSDSQSSITGARELYDEAVGLVGALPVSEARIALEGRLAAVEAILEAAQDALAALAAVNAATTKEAMKAVLEEHAAVLGLATDEGSDYAALYDHLGGWATDSYQRNAANFVIDKRQVVTGKAYATVADVALAFNQGVNYELGKLDFHATVVAGDLNEAAVAAVRGVYHTMGTILGVLEDEELAPLLAMLDCYLEDLSEGEQQRVDAYVLDTVTGDDRKSRDKVFNAMNDEIETIRVERAKDAFLVALDEKVQAIEVAAVTLDGEDVTAIFAKTTEVSDVYGVAQELLAAFKAELEEAELVLTVAGDEATFHLDDENVAVEIARFLLGGLTPEEFLAQRDAVEAGYTATAIDKYGVSFDLEGSLKFQTVFTEAEAKDAFLAALDEKVQAIEVAAVTLDGEDVTAVFAKTTEVSDVYGVAQELLAAFKAELEEAELVLTVGGDEATFHLDDENVAVEIARFLLGGLTPEEFLAQRDAVEAGYTATAIDKYGMEFGLEGILKFQTVFTEAEAKDAFLAALDDKVQAIDVAKVTLDGEDISAFFAKTTEVSDVYGVAQELLAAFKAELEEAELVLTVAGDEATFHLDDENVAVEIARFLLGGLTPEEFLAQRDAVEAGYTATAIDKYGVSFDLEGSLKFQTVFTEAEAKDAFLAALDEKVQAIEVAAVTLDGEDVTAIFAKTTEVSDVYGVAQELLAAFKAELEEAELVLTVAGDEATFHLDDENVAVEIARFLLGGLTPEEFLAQRDAVEAGYTATAIDKYGVSFDLEGSLKFQTVFTEAEAKDAFLAALDDKVQAIEVAAVTLDGEDVTAVFAKTTEVSDVYGVAQDLLAAFKAELEEAELVLTVAGDEATFHLDDENVAVEIARFLLGGLTPEEFLAQRDAVEAGYTATAIDKYGVSFDLEGSLKFQTVFTEAEAKDAFLAALDEKVQAIDVAKVTLDGEDVTAVFAKTTEVSDVYGVAQELLAAFKAELEEAELVLTVGVDEATFHLDDENVAVEIARFLLGGLTPEEFLAQRDAVEAGYTATAIDKYGMEFGLEGSLKFQTVFTEAEAKDAFLVALDEKVQAIEVAAVTLDGEDVTAVFAKTTEVSDVYGVAQELLAAFKAELEEAELVLTVGGDEATFHLDDENVAVEIARFLLGGLTPEEFLAQRDAVEAGYTATAIDKYGVSFDLEGSLKFQTVFTEAEAKDAFLVALDEKVQAIEVAAVTLDGEDVTAVFAKTTEVSDVYGVAQELLAAFKAELEEAELVLTVGGDEATFHLDDENVAVEIARFLLGGLTPEEFLAQRDAVEAGYTATAIDKYGISFDLEGSLKFQTVFTEAEAKDAFLAALDDKVQAIEVAAVTLDGEDVTAVFAKTTEVSDVYGVAQELLAAFKAELEEAELVLTVAGDEATFHLDDENVAVEIARFLLGGLTPEEFLAQRDAVEAGYTATAIDKYGVSFDLEGSLKFQTVFTEAEAKDAFLAALDEKVQAIEVAAVTLDGEDVTAIFAKTTEVSDVYGVAQELLAAFKAELEEAELVLTVAGDEATFHLDDENVAVEIARFLLGGLTPEEFLAQRDAVEAGYTATAIDKYGVSFDLEGSLKFQTVFTEAEAKDAFLAALDEKVQAIEVAAVTLDGEDVTAVFAKTTEVSDVYGVAQELLAAFKAELEEAELVLTVGGDEATFHLDDENVAVEIARFLLGGLTPEEFLAQRDAVEAGYTATAIDKYGMEFGLEGSLKFQTVFTEAEAKDAFLAALDEKVQAIDVAKVILDGEDVTAVFAKTTEVSDVYGVAQELLAAFKAELEEAELVLTVGGDEATFHLDDENVAVEIARFLLGGLTPEEFLAQRDAVEAGYTATAIDKYGVSFDLEGSLKFQTVFTEAEAKDAFLAALDDKAQAIEVAAVTLDGEDVTAIFAKTTEVSDVYGVAQELLAAFKAELEEAELVLTVAGDEATFHLDDENVAVEIARFLLGGLTPEEFLAQRDAVEAGYTATAIDKYGMEFGLEGILKFQTVFTEAEAKDAFLAALDDKVQAIDVAKVTLDGEDISAFFAKTTEVSDVYGVAQELLAAFKAELEEAELVLTVGGDEATFHLDDENVAVEIARFLLGGLTPEEFLAQRDAVEAGYTATAIDKYGMEFGLEGSLKFQTVFTEAEAKDAFLVALDEKVQAIEVAAVTLDGEDVTAVFAKTTEVSDVYGVAQELLAAFKAELEEAELVLTAGGDEATFHLDDENVAVEIARFLLGGLTPEEFLAQRDAVEAGYTATAIDKYGVSFDLEGSLKFQTVFTEAEAKDAFLAALDEKCKPSR